MTKPPHSDATRAEDGALDGGPGSRLQALREGRAMELSYVAQHLHLTVAAVDALERDEFAGLPDPVFVRGYIRAYARLLQVDAAPLIADYNRATHSDPMRLGPVASPRTSLLRRHESSAGAPVLLGLALVGALAGLTWWWFGVVGPAGERSVVEAPSSDSVDAIAEADAESPDGQPALPRAGPYRTPATVPDVTRTVALSEVSAFDPERIEAESFPELGSVAPALPVQPPASPAQSPAPPAAVQVATVEPSPVATEGAEQPGGSTATALSARPPVVRPVAAGVATRVERTPSVGPSEARIVLAFVADSWVEIRDADRVRKLSGIMKADTEKVVTGRTPFSLILGNSHGVKLTFNGRPVDLAPYTRGNVARLQLSEPPPRATEP